MAATALERRTYCPKWSDSLTTVSGGRGGIFGDCRELRVQALIQLQGVANTVRALLDVTESTASNALSNGVPMKLRPRIIARAPVSRWLAVIANAMVGRVAAPRVSIG
jgi:hypothetical protein